MLLLFDVFQKETFLEAFDSLFGPCSEVCCQDSLNSFFLLFLVFKLTTTPNTIMENMSFEIRRWNVRHLWQRKSCKQNKKIVTVLLGPNHELVRRVWNHHRNQCEKIFHIRCFSFLSTHNVE